MILFGTGGIHGRMIPGEFDDELVARVTRGVARWMKDRGKSHALVAYDTRNKSSWFAQLVVSTFIEEGVEAETFERPVPTPLLSYAVRKLGVDLGVVITASHNPPEYNGYKVYRADGVQILPDMAEELKTYISMVNEKDPPRILEKLPVVQNTIFKDYMEDIMNMLSRYRLPRLRMVYSPLHGTGLGFVDEVLKNLGVEVVKVQQQMCMDGNFPTTRTPNPEDDEALEMLKSVMLERDVDYGIATDPDCDRVGLVVKKGRKFFRLSGNQVGVILTHFILNNMKQTDETEEPYLVRTIVSTDMVDPICEEKKVRVFETPTGFKYIGDLITREEAKGNNGFLFAFEESCGYLAGDFVKDKDGVIGSALIALATDMYDPLELLEELYRKYGYFMEKLLNYRFSSVDEAVKVYENMKKKDIERIRDVLVEKAVDYARGVGNIPKNETYMLSFSNGRVYFRPSGTEPKLKVYIKVMEETKEKALRTMERMTDFVNSLIKG